MSKGVKYYHPKVGDIHVGLECDLMVTNADGSISWKSTSCTVDEVTTIINGGLRLDQIRVFYPTQAAMLGDGWVVTVEQIGDSGKFWRLAKDNLIVKWWDNDPQYLEVYQLNTSTNPEGCEFLLYEGRCPSMNEFKQIIKLIGV